MSGRMNQLSHDIVEFVNIRGPVDTIDIARRFSISVYRMTSRLHGLAKAGKIVKRSSGTRGPGALPAIWTRIE